MKRKYSINNLEIINSQIKTLKCDLILQRVNALAHIGGIAALGGLTLLSCNGITKIITIFAGGICLSNTFSLNERIKVSKCELEELESEKDSTLKSL